MAFWITFIMAYPLFLLGSWDSMILLEGSFIQSWMDKMNVDGLYSKDVVSLAGGLLTKALGIIQGGLWKEFHCVVSLFYCMSLSAVCRLFSHLFCA